MDGRGRGGGAGGLGRKWENSNGNTSQRSGVNTRGDGRKGVQCFQLHIFSPQSSPKDKPRPLPFLVTCRLPDPLGSFDLGLLTPNRLIIHWPEKLFSRLSPTVCVTSAPFTVDASRLRLGCWLLVKVGLCVNVARSLVFAERLLALQREVKVLCQSRAVVVAAVWG